MSTRRHNAFTLVEMLVVIAIIGTLVAILVPAVQMAREAARAANCRRNLQECSKAVIMYDQDKGHLPASRTWNSSLNVALNWVYPVLPQLEQDSLHKGIMTGSINLSSSPELPLMESLICPSQTLFAIEDLAPNANYPAGFENTKLSYVVNGGRANNATDNSDLLANGVFVDKGVSSHVGKDKHTISRISDGASNTLMLAETVNAQSYLYARLQQHSQMLWYPEGYLSDPNHDPAFLGVLNRNLDIKPTQFDGETKYARPASRHPGGFNVAKCDGSVQFVADTIDYGVYAVLMTSNGAKANDPTTPVATNQLPEPDWQSPSHADYPGTEP